MDPVVIDASVFVKLIIEEEYSENSVALRDAYIAKKMDIIVPSLFPYEVMNAAKYSNAYNEKELETIGETLENYRFGIYNFNSNFAKVIADISNKYDITMYDASYVALADMTRSLFYTADNKIIKATKLPFVKHIKDFE